MNIGNMAQRAFLKLNKINEQDDHLLLRGELFEGSSFEIVLPKHVADSLEGTSNYLVEVGLVGSKGGNFTEVVLPAPALNYGHHVRVKPGDVISWELHSLAKIQKVQEVQKVQEAPVATAKKRRKKTSE